MGEEEAFAASLAPNRAAPKCPNNKYSKGNEEMTAEAEMNGKYCKAGRINSN
jgi:hypothetical protein